MPIHVGQKTDGILTGFCPCQRTDCVHVTQNADRFDSKTARFCPDPVQHETDRSLFDFGPSSFIPPGNIYCTVPFGAAEDYLTPLHPALVSLIKARTWHGSKEGNYSVGL